MNLDTLEKYRLVFGSLHRNKNRESGPAPHKPILLLAVLDVIERGYIPTNRIEITPELVAAFRDYWRILVTGDRWQERIATPFRFLMHDGFWELRKEGVSLSKQALAMTPTIRQLVTETDGAVLAPDLWELLQDMTALHSLRSFLLQCYFGTGVAEVQPDLHAHPIDYEAEKLKAEAQSQFRVRQVRETKDETGYYIRHALFPTVVKSLYNYACAVCSLNVRTDAGGSLVDAAHIMPFGQFHNDDPRNGICLCKNHHWGFDAGWFTATADHKILVSPHLKYASAYIDASVSLLVPAQRYYAPASEALAWHQQNVYRR